LMSARRIRPTTSRRDPILTIRESDHPPYEIRRPRLRTSRQLTAYVTADVSGWFTSWAIAAVNWPSRDEVGVRDSRVRLAICVFGPLALRTSIGVPTLAENTGWLMDSMCLHVPSGSMNLNAFAKSSLFAHARLKWFRSSVPRRREGSVAHSFAAGMPASGQTKMRKASSASKAAPSRKAEERWGQPLLPPPA